MNLLKYCTIILIFLIQVSCSKDDNDNNNNNNNSTCLETNFTAKVDGADFQSCTVDVTPYDGSELKILAFTKIAPNQPSMSIGFTLWGDTVGTYQLGGPPLQVRGVVVYGFSDENINTRTYSTDEFRTGSVTITELQLLPTTIISGTFSFTVGKMGGLGGNQTVTVTSGTFTNVQ